MDPISILPPKLWGEIFNRINGTQDWLNLYRAHPSFQELFAEIRQDVLFTEAFPHVFKYLKEGRRGKILRLRLVSRQWKEAVDKAFERNSNIRFHRLTLNYGFNRSTQISAFLEKFGNHPTSNPIIGKTIGFSYDGSSLKSSEHKMDYHNLVLGLMTKFGGGIRQMRIAYDLEDFPDSENFLLRLSNFLQLAPNLRLLEISDLHPEREKYSDIVQHIIETLGEPVISHLESLTLYVSEKYKDDWNNLLIRMCCNPKSLTQILLNTIPDQLNMCPNLKSAHLKLESWQDFDALQNVHWPLTHLVLSTNLLIDYPTMFRGIEAFKQTLTSLCVRNLKLDHSGGDDDREYRVDLPHLKSLEVICCSTLDFFANLSALEDLSVFQWDGEDGSDQSCTEFIRIRGIENDMLESNIWQVFPKLKVFRLRNWRLEEQLSQVYTRTQFFRHIHHNPLN